MFKIGEFSKLTKVSVRMLRYYDEQGLLKPAAVDPMTGYRLYATEQVPRLQQIILLRERSQIPKIDMALRDFQNQTIAVHSGCRQKMQL